MELDRTDLVKLHFLGANRQVTGSRYCLEVNDKRVIIDCGMFQERAYQERNWHKSPIKEESVDAVILTHAHIDHCGLLPRFVRDGFAGPIYTTRATADLVEVMLKDAARIQEEDVKYKQKRHKREGRKSPHPYEPLFAEQHAAKAIGLVTPIPYSSTTEVVDGVYVTFHDAGHILGSASVEVTFGGGNNSRRLIFSGDIGQWGKPIIRDPSLFEEADYVVMESTYGDRMHKEGGDISDQLERLINLTADANGKVVIPTFAVERAQELMYYIGGLVHQNRIPDIPIFLDSPMAIDVTDIFRRHRDAYDAETWQLITQGVPPLRFPGLHFVRKAEDSKRINGVNGPAIIMSTSGMCTAGRIKHHLRANIGDPNSTILFVGYQGRGTLGRAIVEGKPEVRIHGRDHQVKARVAQIYGFSGHADRGALLKWIDGFNKPPRHVYLTHGEEEPARKLAEAIRQRGWDVSVPEYLDVVTLS